MSYKRSIRSAVITLNVLLLSACVSLSSLEKTSKLENNESIFVIGVKPDNFRISVFPGDVENGEYKQSLLRPAVVYASPEDGYVVAKANSGDTLAISMVTPYEKGAFLNPTYVACEGGKTLTFKVPSGKVIYIKDVHYRYAGSKIASSYNNDFLAARRYIDKNYVALQDKLEEWPSELLPSNASCSTSITVVVPR